MKSGKQVPIMAVLSTLITVSNRLMVVQVWEGILSAQLATNLFRALKTTLVAITFQLTTAEVGAHKIH